MKYIGQQSHKLNICDVHVIIITHQTNEIQKKNKTKIENKTNWLEAVWKCI